MNELTPEESVQVNSSLKALREQFHGLDMVTVLAAMNLLTAELIDTAIDPDTQPKFLEAYGSLLRRNLASAARCRMGDAGGRVH